MHDRDPKSVTRFLFAAGLLATGIVILTIGALPQFQSRSDYDDMLSMGVMAVGASLIGAGVSLPFARRRVVVSIALASPFLGFWLAVCAYWILMLTFGRWPSQEQMVQSGYQIIPEARQIDDLLGPAWHKLTNGRLSYSREPDIAEWQTEALFGGRYQLTMWVKTEVDRQSGKVSKVIGEPRFILAEVSRISRRGVSYQGGHEFGAEEWQKVVKAKGDFSVIGIRLDRNHPVRGFAEYMKIPRNGIQMKVNRRHPPDD